MQTIIAGLEAVGSIFGENVNKEIAKLVAQVPISGFYLRLILAPIGCRKGSVGDCYFSIWRGHHAVGYVPG